MTLSRIGNNEAQYVRECSHQVCEASKLIGDSRDSDEEGDHVPQLLTIDLPEPNQPHGCSRAR